MKQDEWEHHLRVALNRSAVMGKVVGILDCHGLRCTTESELLEHVTKLLAERDAVVHVLIECLARMNGTAAYATDTRPGALPGLLDLVIGKRS